MTKRILLLTLLVTLAVWNGCAQEGTNTSTRDTPTATPTPTPTPRPTVTPTSTPTPTATAGPSESPEGGHGHPPHETHESQEKVMCRCTCEGRLLWERELTEAECTLQCPDGMPCE